MPEGKGVTEPDIDNMTDDTARAPRKRGRPAKKNGDSDHGELVKQRLLEAAKACLSEKSYRNVTTREIADAADSNLGMIRYYFGGKDGLLSALIQEAALSVEGFLGAMDTFDEVPPRQRTHALVSAFFDLCLSSPWFVRLIIDDITNTDPKLRASFNDNIGHSSKALLFEFIRRQKDDGYYRKDINDQFTLVSMISLLVLPFISTPMFKETYGVDIHGFDKEQWTEHLVNLLEQGLS